MIAIATNFVPFTLIPTLSIPFAIVGIFYSDAAMQLIDEVSLIVNISIILSNLLALKSIADELVWSCRIFIVGVWTIDAILIVLALFDAYNFLTLSWLSIVEYLTRLLQIFIYTTIGAQTIQFWSMYSKSSSPSPAAVIAGSMSGISGGSERGSAGRRRGGLLNGDENEDFFADISTAVLQALLIAVVLAGFGAAVGISEEKAWRIMNW